jgi:hypothetical protein
MLMHHREARLADLRPAKDTLSRYTNLGVPAFGPPSSSALLTAPPVARSDSGVSLVPPSQPTVRSNAPPSLTEALGRSLPPGFSVPPPSQQSGVYSPGLGTGPRVKGVAFRSSIDAFKRVRGAVAFEAVRARLPPELADALDRGLILHSGWFPIEWYAGMFAAMRAATGEGPELLTLLGEVSVEIDFRGVYRALLRLLSPERLFARSTAIFSRYFSAGCYEVIESRAGFVRGRWVGCQGFDANLWAEVIGSSRRMLELAGAKGVVTQVVAGGRDADDFMEVTGTWTSQRAGSNDPPAQLGGQR